MLCACSNNTVRENKQNTKNNKPSEVNEYPYANSTDIYSAELDALWKTRYYQCKLDGTDKKEIFLGEDESGYGYAILSVSNTYLYFYECNEDGKIRIWRVSLKKGDDGRDQIHSKPDSVTDWLELSSNYTVVEHYFVKIGNRTSQIKNIDTGQEDKGQLPEILNINNRKTKESEWFVLGKGNGWVLWGGNALMLQMVPSNECIVLETRGNTNQASVSIRNNRIYYALENEKGVSCWVYEVGLRKKKQLAGEKSLEKGLYRELAISKKKIQSYKLEWITFYENKCYLQFIVSYREKRKVKKKYYMLSVNADIDKKVYQETKLNQILREKSYIEKETEEKVIFEHDKSKYIGHVGDLWYIQAKTIYCYNMKTEKLKKISSRDPEYNMYFAIRTM